MPAFVPTGRGNGYALEAAEAVLEYATRTLRLARIAALTAPDNQHSMRLLEKLGFRFERMIYLTGHTGPSRFFVRDAPG